MLLKRKWKLYLIHHTHTDVGYTDRQEKIERIHCDFIRQAISICESGENGQNPTWQGFKWTCESFWGVERFLESSSLEEKNKLIKMIKERKIDISANYLNMTELVNKDLFKSMTKRAIDYGKSFDFLVKSAMTADVNGFSLGWAEALIELGVENLFTCVHTYHGMFPLRKKQIPFWWEMPNNKRLLVWSSEHYQIGNELGIVPGGFMSWCIKDEFSNSYLEKNHDEIARERILRYLCKLEEENYPFDFVPITVHGTISDNAPPNPEIMDFINRWNLENEEVIKMEMTTLTNFFEMVRGCEDIPVYKGDWPDWWTDGVGSNPKYVKIFNEAQRELKRIKDLNKVKKFTSEDVINQIEYNLMLFGEHTYGHYASVSEPFNNLVQLMEARKNLYAIEANRLVFSELDNILSGKGETQLLWKRPLRYKIINSFNQIVENIASLTVDFWELNSIKYGFEVIDEKTGCSIPYQIIENGRGYKVEICVCLEPSEEKLVYIRPKKKENYFTTYSSDLKGVDGVADINPLDNSLKVQGLNGIVLSQNKLENDLLRITWKKGQGIISIFDKLEGVELFANENQSNPFTPIYEVTPIYNEDNCTIRRDMGRNKKGPNVIRRIGSLTAAKIIETGTLFDTVELVYEIEGIDIFSIIIKAYKCMSKLNITARIKKSVKYEPESLYLSLPFFNDKLNDNKLWINRASEIIKPWEDQLPGTLTDYYCVHEGIGIANDGYGLSIAMPDTPLLQLGSLEYKNRVLSDDPQLSNEEIKIYSWVLNNVWDTNFNVDIGGFYDFNYVVSWGSTLNSKEKVIRKCEEMNQGLISIRVSN